MTRRTLGLSCLALLSLGLGSLVYLIRPAGSSHLPLNGFNSDLPLLAALPGINSLPSFFHVVTFALLSAAVLGPSRWKVRLSCLMWLGIGSLFELGQHERISVALQDLPLGLGTYFYRGTFDSFDILACALGAGFAYLILRFSHAPERRTRLGPLSLLGLLVLTGCPFEEPNYGFAFMKVESSSIPTELDNGSLCPDEGATLSWISDDAGDLRLDVKPPQNLQPLLKNKAVDARGELAITLKDSVVISLGSEQVGFDEIILSKAPDAVCADFEVPLIGWYEGSFEQTEPEALSRAARMQLFWNAEQLGLKGIMYLEKALSPLSLSCSANGPRQQIDCVQQDNTDAFVFSASGTKTGLSGTYAGAEEDASVRIPFSGSFEMSKRDSEPPPLAD